MNPRFCRRSRGVCTASAIDSAPLKDRSDSRVAGDPEASERGSNPVCYATAIDPATVDRRRKPAMAGPRDGIRSWTRADGERPMPYAGLGLEGQVALVTGSARGIGAALAVGLAQAGAHVAVSDMAERLELAREHPDPGGIRRGPLRDLRSGCPGRSSHSRGHRSDRPRFRPLGHPGEQRWNPHQETGLGTHGGRLGRHRRYQPEGAVLLRPGRPPGQ